MNDYLSHSNILVCAKEAGSGAFLAALLNQNKGRFRGRIVAYASASRYFVESEMDLEIIDGTNVPNAQSLLERQKPDAVLVGGSAGWNLEKDLILEANALSIPTYMFIDHYWNLWQRFAEDKTAVKWRYMPSRCYVIDDFARKRLIELGYPEDKVGVEPHPVLKNMEHQVPVLDSNAVKRDLGIPSSAKIFLFVSEYGFTQSQKWKWEQPKQADIFHLCQSILHFAHSRMSDHQEELVIVIKMHPSEDTDWSWVLEKFPNSIYRVVRDYDKLSLVDAADAVFGLNSMLLLEAVARKKRVFSLHKFKGGRDAWLSSINPSIIEVPTAKALDKFCLIPSN